MEFIKKNWPFLLGLLLTVSVLWPLVWAPFFTHHDDVQTIRLYEMDRCIKDHQIPCRWVPDLGGLYGYPLFNYYAPLPYYFGELIYLLTNNLIFSVKIMFSFSFIGSFVFMYLFARKFWGNLGGSMSALFYSFAPYHALDFYVRGAMGEMWGLMFFPAILWALVKLEEKVNLGNLLLLSVFVCGLIISHNLSALIFLPISIIWMIILYLKSRQQKFFWFSLNAFILGMMLSAFYLLPVTFEKELTHVDTTTYGYFSYTEHFKGFKKLFLERTWGYGASVREVPGGERDGLSYQIGWIHLLGWVLALYTGFKLWNKKRWLSIVIFVSSIFISYAVFMVNPRSKFIWELVESFKYIQFPWRFLMIVILFISFVAGSISLVLPKKWSNSLVVLLMGLVVITNFFYFKPEKFLQVTDKDLLSGANWDRLIKRSILDYLPIYAKEPPAELATKRYEILTGDSQIQDFKEGSNWISFKTDTSSHTIIRLSQYYFPDWKVFVDGTPIIIDYNNNNLGLMTFILGKGTHKVEARLFDTPIRSFGNLLSASTAILMLLLFLVKFDKVKKWAVYYRKRIN